jgi:hypothetical protein
LANLKLSRTGLEEINGDLREADFSSYKAEPWTYGPQQSSQRVKLCGDSAPQLFKNIEGKVQDFSDSVGDPKCLRWSSLAWVIPAHRETCRALDL